MLLCKRRVFPLAILSVRSYEHTLSGTKGKFRYIFLLEGRTVDHGLILGRNNTRIDSEIEGGDTTKSYQNDAFSLSLKSAEVDQDKLPKRVSFRGGKYFSKFPR